MMGYMGCYRCDMCMCDHRIIDRYICHECLEELEEHRRSWPEPMTQSEMECLIGQFMDSTKGSTYPPPTAPQESNDEIFERLIRRSHT